ncbi:MAG: EamA family transporter [Melioribacteraceae bacterium]|nr:EamA family transporter [Melioribacteraceae bacterium]
MKKNENFKAYAAWISICIIWGTTYLAIRIGVEDLPPILFAGLRWLIAGPILFVFLRLKGMPLPKKEDIIPMAIVGLALLGIGNGFVVFAEQSIPSGLTSLLITTVPFWIVGLETLMPKGARMNLTILFGLLLGLTGIVLIFGGDLDSLLDPKFFVGVISLMIAVVGWSAGTLYSKYKKVSVHPLMGASVQMMIAGVVLTILGISLGESSSFHFSQDSLIAFVYLIIFGSIIGYTSYIYAIAHLPVSLVSTYAYVNPIIALFLGWLVLNEKITIEIFIAAAIILAGVALVKRGTSISRVKFIK